MKSDPDCIPYALTQVLATARVVTEDPWIHRKVLLRALADLANEADLDKTAPEIIFTSLTTAYKALGVSDPYENEKARVNKAVAALEEEYRKYLDEQDDSLAAGLRLALAGTALEGREVHNRVAAEEAINAACKEDPAIDDSEALLKALARAESVLYVVNNSGEVILDKLFIEYLARGRKVAVVARHNPILNDVTIDEARDLGVGDSENVELLDPGAPMLGVWLEKGSKELRTRFNEADVVICKGQANYESLCTAEREIYFLMRAHSVAISKRLEVDPDNLCLLRYRPAVGAATGEEKAAPAKRRK